MSWVQIPLDPLHIEVLIGLSLYHYYLAIKLSKNELQKDSEDPVTLFRNGIKFKMLKKYEQTKLAEKTI